ncbi:MAG: pyruvate formate lyase family protein [Candidatus Latescibacterota bacterium]
MTAVASPRHKNVRSTTLERLRKTRQVDREVAGLPQPLQLGEGFYRLLGCIDVAVEPGDLIVGRIREEVPDEAGEAELEEIVAAWNGRPVPPWMRDGGHECFAWERLLHLGLTGLQAEAQERLVAARAAAERQAVQDFLAGAVRLYQAFRRYAERYAQAAGAAGLPQAAQACQAAADGPPATFAEALQLVWLVGHVYCTMTCANPTLTFGRLDLLLAPFYRADLRAGQMTRQRAGDLIADFYGKNEAILGRGEHQMSGGGEHDTGWIRNLTYDAPQYVVLGGRRPTGVPPFDEVTTLFLERVDPSCENPVIVLRYHRELPGQVWEAACDRMAANASFMVYSDECVIPAMVACGVRAEDAVTYTLHGCNWPDIPGVQRALDTPMPVLPALFLDALLSLDGPLVSIDVLYERFAAHFAEQIQQACDRFRCAREAWDAQAPGPLHVDDCFLDGPIQAARSWTVGGVRYPNLVCALISLATTADSFAAVDELVVRQRRVALRDLQAALRADFAGQEALRRLCLRAPKFGQDDERADGHARRVLETVQRQIDRAAQLGTPGEVVVFRCLETDMRHIGLGRRVGATPDGRHAGEPLSENTSPYPGSCVHGLTAMLRSVASLPLGGINSGALNVRLTPAMVAGPQGRARLAALLRGYFDMGGLQAQLSIVDTERLRAAQACPERHRDLMVRITGYSAVFVDMAPAAQEEILRREEISRA